MTSTTSHDTLIRSWVFGGSSGIGEATAAGLAALDHAVTIVGRDASRLEAAARRLGDKVSTAVADASRRIDLERLYADAGPIDHLVLCHGGTRAGGNFAQLDLDELRASLDEKLLAQLRAAQAALPSLRPGGSITFISGAAGRTSMPGTLGFAANNAALDAAVRVLACELAPLRVNAVSPGVIDTPLWDGFPAAAKAGFFEHAARQLPVRRVGRPQDIAQAVLALVTNGFMTGTVIEADGGARMPADRG